MNPEKVELKAVELAKSETENQKPAGTEPIAPAAIPAALFNIVKLSDGSVQFNFGGPESDVLGLIEFARLLLVEQMRENAKKAMIQKQQMPAAASEAVAPVPLSS